MRGRRSLPAAARPSHTHARVITFTNTYAAQPIREHPRATYRVVIERSPGAYLSFLTGVLRWPKVVSDVVNASGNPAASALGGSTEPVLSGDTVATLDFLAKRTAVTATVADLVNAVDAASPYARVASVTRRDPVPGFSEGGPDVFNAERAAEQEATQERAERESLGAQLAGGLGVLRNYGGLVAVAAVVTLIVLYAPRTGGSAGSGASWE